MKRRYQRFSEFVNEGLTKSELNLITPLKDDIINLIGDRIPYEDWFDLDRDGRESEIEDALYDQSDRHMGDKKLTNLVNKKKSDIIKHIADELHIGLFDEALKVMSTEPGRKKVNIMVGRFQPPTLGHLKVLKSLSDANGLPVVVFIIRAKKRDLKKTPFEVETTEQIFNELVKKHKFIEEVKILEGAAAIDTIFNMLRPEYEPILWGTGTDRMKAYSYQVDREEYRNDLNVDPEFKLHEIKRGDENISASKVRAAIEKDDEKLFQSMMDPVTHSFYPLLKTELTGDK